VSADHDGAPLSHAVAPTGPPGGGAPVHAVQIGFEDVDFGARGIGLPIVEAHCRYTAPLGLEGDAPGAERGDPPGIQDRL